MLRIGRVLLGLIMVQALAACGILVVGGVAGTAAVMSDRRSPGIQAIDVGIEYEAGNKLSQLFGDNAHVNVTAFNQKVLLTGEAKDENIKAEAGKYVGSLKNARAVFNELVIGPNSQYSARANDAYLASKIKTQMIFTNNLPSNSMNIIAEGANVYLMGILTQSEAEEAKKIASNTPGVKEVYAYFDIISNDEKMRLENLGKARKSGEYQDH